MTPSSALIVGDVGSTAAFHVGDEAMLEALVTAPGGPDWTVVSLDPAATSARLGVAAVPRLGFRRGDDETVRDARLAALLGFDAAGGVPAGDAAAPTFAALDSAQALVVAGGGNLSSTWPEHVYERVALMTLARRRGLPVVVSGQTLGPRLIGRERELLAEALRGAVLVGVREQRSQLLALDLGVHVGRLRLQLDDAILLGDDGDDDGGGASAVEPFIAVTLCTLGPPEVEDGLMDGLASQLARIARHTGTALVLVPHEGALDGSSSNDVRAAESLERRLRMLDAPVSITGMLSPADTARLTRRASLVIASRYHPLVFALGGGVPAIGIYLDGYTRTKTCGALAFAGLEDWALHVRLAAAGLLEDAALELWERRDEVSRRLADLKPGWRDAVQAHQRSVLAAVGGHPLEPVAPPPAPQALRPGGAWSAAAGAASPPLLAAAEELRELTEYAGSLQRNFATAERYALSLRAALDEAQGKPAAPPDDGPAGPSSENGSRRSHEVVLTDLRHEQAGADAHASMLLRCDGRDLGRLVLRRHGAGLDEIDRTGTPFAAIASVLATVQERDVRLDAPVDEVARANAELAGAKLGSWFGWRPARIACETTSAAQPAASIGMFLSRGLDSMATYARQHDRLDVLVSMDWRDPPYATDGTAAIWRGTQRCALDAGLQLLAVSTNAREFLDPVAAWDFTHGCVLGSLGQLLSPDVGELLVAGAFPPGREAPAGTHPELDPLWSSSAVRLAYDSGGGGRNEKAALVADMPFCVRHLKVCWERPGDGNCGRCCKCLLTMTNFYVNGRLDDVRECFEAPLTPEAVEWAARYGTPTTPLNGQLVLDRLGAHDPLRAPWEKMLERALSTDAATIRRRASEAVTAT